MRRVFNIVIWVVTAGAIVGLFFAGANLRMGDLGTGVGAIVGCTGILISTVNYVNAMDHIDAHYVASMLELHGDMK